MNASRKRPTVVACLTLLATLSHGHAALDSPVESYSVENEGRLIENIRIEKKGNKYLVFRNQNGKWVGPEDVKPVTKDEFEKVLGEPIKVEFDGLANDYYGVFRVPKGWKWKGLECKTGFWLMSILGPIELHKK